MKKYSIDLTRFRVASVLILGSIMTVGCAGNSAKPSSSIPVEPVAAVDTTSEINQSKTSPDAIAAITTEHELAITEPVKEPERFPYTDISAKGQPKQMKFFFGFDKSSLDETDKIIIKEHARFMIDNPGLIMQISGHTDKHGAREYNEYLSKQRASEVAKIMISEGVPESQLVIKALANDKPLLEAEDSRKNRRVELEYQELNVVSNQ